jgi:hypothetical protein
MLKSTLVAVGTLAILGSIGQNAQAVTDRIDRLLTPRSHLNIQAQVMMNNNKPGDGGNNPPQPIIRLQQIILLQLITRRPILVSIATHSRSIDRDYQPNFRQDRGQDFHQAIFQILIIFTTTAIFRSDQLLQLSPNHLKFAAKVIELSRVLYASGGKSNAEIYFNNIRYDDLDREF